MLQTMWCLAVTAFSLFLAGAPVQWLLGGRRPLDERGWVRAPFLGVAVIVLVLQNLVYCDAPIDRTAWAVWALAALLWIPIALQRQLRACLAAFPWRLYAVVALVYAVQATGLFVLRAKGYVGRAWSDQFNYTAMAEFYAHLPWNTTLDVAGDKPWLTWAINFKCDRIGQSILQGFLAVSSAASTKTLFEPTILLSPALTTLALYALARRFGLGEWRSLGGAAAGGLLPGLTSLHLDCFLSHALAVPLLLLFPLALDEWNERPSFGALLRAGLLLTAVVSVYTEFTILLAGLLALSLAFAVAGRGPWLRLLAGYAVLACSPFLLNWHFFTDRQVFTGLWSMVARTSLPVLQTLYPWAFSFEGWERVWLGDMATLTPAAGVMVLRLFTAAATALAFFGLFGRWRDAFASACGAWGEADRRRTLGLTSCVLALTLLPIAVVVKDGDHPYQFYKLILTTCPLWALGLALLSGPAAPPQAGRWRRVLQALPAGGALALALALGAAGTVFMVWQETLPTPHVDSAACRLTAPDMLRLQDLLERTSGGDVVVAHFHGLNSSWLAYYARKNRVWLANPLIVDANLGFVPQAANMLAMKDLPADALIVTEHGGVFRRVSPGDLSLVGSGQSFQLWRSTSHDWALPLILTNPNGLGEYQGLPLFFVGGPPTVLDLYAGRPGVLTLSAEILPGPSLTGTDVRRLRVRAPSGQLMDYELRPGRADLKIPIVAGRSAILLQALDAPNQAMVNGDPRPFLIGVHGLEVAFAPSDP